MFGTIVSNMRHLKNIAIAVVIGLLTVAITNQFTSSKYPPCDLVAQGISISTYGCSNTASSNYPCKNEVANSESMKKCIQANYYRAKTFPFGFKQHFGDSSNLVDKKPLRMNAIASFATVAIISLAITYLYESRKSVKSHQKSES